MGRVMKLTRVIYHCKNVILFNGYKECRSRKAWANVSMDFGFMYMSQDKRGQCYAGIVNQRI